MQIVIEIPEFAYIAIKEYGLENCKPMLIHNTSNAIKAGTPLPKGHGRLGDLDELAKDMIYGIRSGNEDSWYAEYPHINDVDDCVDLVKYYDTIIEADGGGENGNSD